MEHDVPEKLAAIMDKIQAAEDLRDKCIKSPFGFRRAKKCAADVYFFRRKFWKGVFEIYPELKGKEISYSYLEQKIIEKPLVKGINKMKCECGFIFAGPGEFRNCEARRDKTGQWWAICPKCGKEHKDD